MSACTHKEAGTRARTHKKTCTHAHTHARTKDTNTFTMAHSPQSGPSKSVHQDEFGLMRTAAR